MSGSVVAVVLGAALLHGSWNAIAKAVPDRLVSSTLIALVYLVVGGVACAVVPLPDPAAWPYLLVSAAVQTAYLLLLTAAYARSEFASAYPLTRGVAVLGVTLVSTVFLGERTSAAQLGGVAVVALALLALAWAPRGRAGASGMVMSVVVGVTVTVYSVLDGVGVRLSGEPLSYAAWLFLLQGVAIPLTCLALARDRGAFARGLRDHSRLGVLGGVLSLVAYTIVVWAQSVAPLSVVSALRETGVLAAGAIGFLVFREPLSARRVLATLCAVAGIVVIRLGM